MTLNKTLQIKKSGSPLSQLGGSEMEYSQHHVPSHRELEIIDLLSRGWSTQEIADRLHLSEHTVSTHRKKIIRKTRTRNTVELVAISIREGWIT